MDGLIALIGVFVPILGIGVGLAAVIGHFRLKEQQIKLRIAEAQGGADAAAAKITQAELEKLKDRVAVLERLLTDDDRRLADEIGRLKTSDEVRR